MERRAQGKKLRAKSGEQRAKSKEQRAGSKEQKVPGWNGEGRRAKGKKFEVSGLMFQVRRICDS
jgi:hypothetical protein